MTVEMSVFPNKPIGSKTIAMIQKVNLLGKKGIKEKKEHKEEARYKSLDSGSVFPRTTTERAAKIIWGSWRRVGFKSPL
jgi:hypothetical protein